MFGSEILDLTIGLVFLYLLISLIVSTLYELAEAWLKMRAVDLERSIRQLLDDPDGTCMARKLYEHPLVFTLFQGNYTSSERVKNPLLRLLSGTNLPSYIPKRNFALALMDIVLPATPKELSGTTGATIPQITSVAMGTPTTSLKPLRDAICDGKDTPVGKALLALLDAAGDDVNGARKNIEDWYDSAMDRIAGWYKRRAQVVALVLGLCIAIIINADTFAIGNSLLHDSAMRDSLVAAAQEYAQSRPEDAKGDPEKRILENLDRIESLGLPVGWAQNDIRRMPLTPEGWLVKGIGWLLTAIAVSLGAPFWFDLLNKVMVIRSTVKPHEKSPEEPSADR